MAAVARKKAKKPRQKRKRKPGSRTPWHLLLFLLLLERAPRSFRVRAEVLLGEELPRADVVLLRREQQAGEAQGQVLHGLWSRIAQDAVVEFKSVTHGFRRGELGKLLAYTALYYWQEAARLGSGDNLAMVLLVPSLTPLLQNELADLKFRESEDREGYRQYGGGPFPLLVLELGRVAEAERDDLLGFLGRGTMSTDEAKRWVSRKTGLNMGKMKQMDEYEDYAATLVEALGDKVLASMTPEQVLARYTPEQVLVHYAPEQVLAGLSETQKAGLRRLLLEQQT
jgi:hypothetical protein